MSWSVWLCNFSHREMSPWRQVLDISSDMRGLANQMKWTLLPGLAQLRMPLEWVVCVTAVHSSSQFQGTGMVGSAGSVLEEWLSTVSVMLLFKSYRTFETRDDAKQHTVLSISCSAIFFGKIGKTEFAVRPWSGPASHFLYELGWITSSLGLSFLIYKRRTGTSYPESLCPQSCVSWEP